MKLLLFDIDGTIVELQDGHGPKGHRYAIKVCIEKTYGTDSYAPKLTHSGLTDKQIIFHELKLRGLKDIEIKLKLKQCMNVMVDAFKNYDNSNLVAIEGIKELLEELSHKENVLIGLLTGNVEEIAYEKMKLLGLRDYFKVGSFGSDPHEKRSDLVDVAKEKAEKLGHKIDEIYVIGDTPRDIQAGKEANVKTIAVATGTSSKDELKKYNPDYLLEDFKNTEEFMKTIGI